MSKEIQSADITIGEEQNGSGVIFSVFKDCCVTAVVAFLLSGVLLGFRLLSGIDGVELVPQPFVVFYFVLVATTVRFLTHVPALLRKKPRYKTPFPPKKSDKALFGKGVSFLFRRAGILLTVFGILLPLLPFADRQILDLSILIMTYIMLGWGLNIVVGLAGLLDLGYVAFYAVGAYSYALLSTALFPWMISQGYLPPVIMDFVFWMCVPIAGILAALWGLCLGFPVLRLRGDYLAIVTLAFSEIVRLVLVNWSELTGGANGISRIPRPSFFGIHFTADENGFDSIFGLDYNSVHKVVFLYYIIFFFALMTNFVTLRLRKMPIGRAWEALREDETACRSLGINVTNTKLTAFATGAMFGGIAGSFFATKQGFVSPESFIFLESVLILAVVVLGGLGSQIGIAFSAIILIGGIEFARKLEHLKFFFGDDFDPSKLRMLLFGVAMILIMLWRPRGVVVDREPSILLKKGGVISGDFVSEGRG